MKIKGLVIVLLALTALLVGCNSGPADSPSLEDTQWLLVKLKGEPPMAGRVPSAEFSADQISGSAGCNTYFGAYEASDGELSIGDIARTEMWCMDPEGVMDQEQAFLDDLASVTSYRLAGERLELLDGTGEVILTFEPRAAEE